MVVCTDCLDALQIELIETLRTYAAHPNTGLFTNARGLVWYTPDPERRPPAFLTPAKAPPFLAYTDRRTYIDAHGHPLV